MKSMKRMPFCQCSCLPMTFGTCRALLCQCSVLWLLLAAFQPTEAVVVQSAQRHSGTFDHSFGHSLLLRSQSKSTPKPINKTLERVQERTTQSAHGLPGPTTHKPVAPVSSGIFAWLFVPLNLLVLTVMFVIATILLLRVFSFRHLADLSKAEAKHVDPTSPSLADIANEPLQHVQRALEKWESDLLRRFSILDGADTRDKSVDTYWKDFRHPAQVLAARARAHPKTVAYEHWVEQENSPRKQATYDEFVGSVQAVARLLVHDRGAVAVAYMSRGPELAVSMWACFFAGLSVTSVDRSYPWERVRFTLEDTRAAVLLTGTSEDSSELESSEGLRVLIVCDILRYPSPYDICASLPRRSDDEPCAIIYTSGSTGRPKGVQLSLGGFSNYCCIDQHLVDFRPGERSLLMQSLSFVSGFMETFRPLVAGGSLVIADENIAKAGPDLLYWISKANINIFKCVPTLLRAMIGNETSPSIPPQLRVMIVSGEALEKDLVRRLHGGAAVRRSKSVHPLVVLNTYGPTELNANCTVSLFKPLDEKVTIGWPYPSYKVYCLDEENRPGEIGELCVSGMSLANGYLGKPEATAAVFFEHPDLGRLYRTGDKGKKESTGQFSYIGRIAQCTQVKINGYRVELGEVEHALRKLPAVKEAVAVFVDSKLAAVVAPRDGAALELKALRAEMYKGGLVPHALPSQLVVVCQLPTTISGKLDRGAAAAMVKADLEAKATASAEQGSNEVEFEIRVVMASVLNLGSWRAVQPDDDFFMIGGTSATAGALVSELRRQRSGFALISVKTIFEHPTPVDLAALVQRDGDPTVALVPSVQREDSAGVIGVAYPNVVMFCQLVYICLMLALRALRKLSIIAASLYGYSIMSDATKLARISAGMVLMPLFAMAAMSSWNYAAACYLVLLKYVVLGRYRAGRYALHGSMHFRHWLIEYTERSLMNWDQVSAFEQKILYRLLGATIGDDTRLSATHIVAWDLVSIGHQASCCHCKLTPVSYDSVAVTFGKISIHENASLRPRSTAVGPTVVHQGATLDYMSSISNVDIPANERWRGSPAKREGESAAIQPDLKLGRPILCYGGLLTLLQAATHLGIVAVCLLPVLVIWNFCELSIIGRLLFAVSVGSILRVPVESLIAAAACRLACCGVVAQGTYHWNSSAALLAEYAAWCFALPQDALNNTWLLVSFMRLAGARVGERANMAQLRAAVPGLVNIGEECFFANWVHAGFPLFERGVMELHSFCAGKESLFGNRSLIPPGSRVPPRSIGGVLSVPPSWVVQAPDLEEPTSGDQCALYLGNPPISLEDRKRVALPISTSMQHFCRNVADVVVVILPQVLHRIPMLAWALVVITCAMRAGLDVNRTGFRLALISSTPYWLLAATIPLLVVFQLAGAFMLATVARIVRGWRIAPGQHEYWSSYVDCWHVNNKILSVCVYPDLLEPFSSTRWVNYMVSLISSAQIASSALILGCGTWREMDLVRIGERVVVNEAVVFRTHTFENWMLQFGVVTVRDGAVVGCNAELMTGSVLEFDCEVCVNTIVNKGEEVPAGACFAGLPGAVVGYKALRQGLKDSKSTSEGESTTDLSDTGTKSSA
eukprot:TRINITY_DN17109_c0_g1_i1.p1 TRINITY_DN17109_c0_g1~~TRINITY_DN17109_c0_g1_i1.p1  ORF type:complete len:1601 (+),score=182.29 TRINITY_DN17109_c0_g1_i1:43-4803(+)